MGLRHAQEGPAGPLSSCTRPRATRVPQSGPAPRPHRAAQRPRGAGDGGAGTAVGEHLGLTGTHGDTQWLTWTHTGSQERFTRAHALPWAASVPAEGATSGKKAPAPGAFQCDSLLDRGSNSGGRLKGVFDGEIQTAGFSVKDYQVCIFGFLTEPSSENTF